MNYELAKKLKDAGFPFQLWHDNDNGPRYWEPPTLSELIEACGGRVSIEAVKDYYLDDVGMGDGFIAWPEGNYASLEFGTTHEEAVANLWLALNTPK